MVTDGESETWVRVDAHQPPPGTSDFPDDNLPSNPCNNLASRDSFSNVSLIHPEALTVPGDYRHTIEHINAQFCAAALSNLPESADITRVSFQDIMFWQ